MARQFTDEERDAMERGGRWLRAERIHRGFEHGTDFANALGIRQVRLSSYERGLYPVPETIARRIAKVLGLSELVVWRGLCLPGPVELRSDQQWFDDWQRRDPTAVARLLEQVARTDAELRSKDSDPRSQGPDSPTRPRVKPPGATRPGDAPNTERRGQQPAV